MTSALDLGAALAAEAARRAVAPRPAPAMPPAAAPTPAPRVAPAAPVAPAPVLARTPAAILRRAAELAGDPPFAAHPDRALYAALEAVPAGPRRARAVHDAVRGELRARYPTRPIRGGLRRLGAEAGPAAVAAVFAAAAARVARGASPPSEPVLGVGRRAWAAVTALVARDDPRPEPVAVPAGRLRELRRPVAAHPAWGGTPAPVVPGVGLPLPGLAAAGAPAPRVPAVPAAAGPAAAGGRPVTVVVPGSGPWPAGVWAGLHPPYATLVADPPWPYPARSFSGWNGPRHLARHRHGMPYRTLSLAAISALPVGELASPEATASAELYLWTTSRFLRDAFGVLAAWGFPYRQTLTWAKPPMGHLPGGTFASTVEFILYGRRGRRARLTREPTSWWGWPRLHRHGPVHSAKPPAFLDLVERVSPGPYLELFARSPRLGWDAWGWGWGAPVADAGPDLVADAG